MAMVKRRPTNPWDLRGSSQDYEANIAQTGAAAQGYGQQATESYLDKSINFDAGEAYDEYMGGAQNRLDKTLKTRLEDLSGQAVGAGRIDTGFFDVDRGQVIQDVASNYADTASSAALATSGQNLQNMGGLANFGVQNTEIATDAAASMADRAMMRENARKEEERRKRAGIGSMIGTALGAGGGFLLGGPAGAFTGAKIGAGVGGSF